MKETKSDKNCSKCGTKFSCKSDEENCWCMDYQLSKEQLDALKENYDNCLCEKCLAQISICTK